VARRTASIYLAFSPWILAVACVLLILLLGLFGISNYQREKELLGRSMEQRGLTLMRFINSSTREAIRNHLRAGEALPSWEVTVREAMEQAAEQPGVVSVLLVDEGGAIIAATGEQTAIRVVAAPTLEMLRRLSRADAQAPVSRVVGKDETGGAGYRYQVGAWQLAPNFPERFQEGGGMGRRMPLMRRHGERQEFSAWQEEMKRLRERPLIYVVELDFQHFSGSLQHQLLQLVLLAVVILLVVIGGALSYLTLQGLRGSQQRLGAMRAFADRLVSALPLGVIATDGAGLIRLCNGTAAAILQTEAAGLLGKMPRACLPSSLADFFEGAGGDRGARPSEVVFDHDPQRILILQASTMTITDDRQRLEGEVLLLRDLTEIRSLEKELRRSERLAALGKMAAGVAHELRNPLSSIKGLAMVLREGRSREAVNESGDLLIKEVERLNRSIGELLDYARPENLRRGMVSVAELVGKSVSLVQADAGSLNIDIKIDIPQKLPLVYVDGDKINQVLLNLLLNGVQAMPEGGLLSISAICDEQMVTLKVRDNGEGISEAHLSKIFDPYFTTKSGGTGLGLAITAKIIEEHGGTIRVGSRRGEFTEVSIMLPLSPEAAA